MEVCMFNYHTTTVYGPKGSGIGPIGTEFRDFGDMLFRDLFSSSKDWSTCYNAKIEYPVDIRHNNEILEIDIAATGIEKELIKIDIEGELLIVSYTKPDPTEADNDWSYISRKIKNGSFKFVWNLSDDLNSEKLKASFENGIVKISIPMKEEKVIKKRSVNIE